MLAMFLTLVVATCTMTAVVVGPFVCIDWMAHPAARLMTAGGWLATSAGVAAVFAATMVVSALLN